LAAAVIRWSLRNRAVVILLTLVVIPVVYSIVRKRAPLTDTIKDSV